MNFLKYLTFWKDKNRELSALLITCKGNALCERENKASGFEQSSLEGKTRARQKDIDGHVTAQHVDSNG